MRSGGWVGGVGGSEAPPSTPRPRRLPRGLKTRSRLHRRRPREGRPPCLPHRARPRRGRRRAVSRSGLRGCAGRDVLYTDRRGAAAERARRPRIRRRKQRKGRGGLANRGADGACRPAARGIRGPGKRARKALELTLIRKSGPGMEPGARRPEKRAEKAGRQGGPENAGRKRRPARRTTDLVDLGADGADVGEGGVEEHVEAAVSHVQQAQQARRLPPSGTIKLSAHTHANTPRFVSLIHSHDRINRRVSACARGYWARMRARVRPCVRLCVCVRARACVHACVCVRVPRARW